MPEVRMSQFADDTTPFAAHSNAIFEANKLQRELDDIENSSCWLEVCCERLQEPPSAFRTSVASRAGQKISNTLITSIEKYHLKHVFASSSSRRGDYQMLLKTDHIT